MTVWLSRLTGACRALLARRATERELDEELRTHFEMAAEQKIEAGLSHVEARRETRLEMGNPEVVKERVRDVGWESVVDAVGMAVQRQHPPRRGDQFGIAFHASHVCAPCRREERQHTRVGA